MFNFLKKDKKTNIQTILKLKYKISFNDKEIEQTQYLTDNYVLTEINNKKILYISQNDKQYVVDTENKQLKELDLSNQMIQMNQLKSMIGEITINEYFEGETKHILLQNSLESQTKLEVKMQILPINRNKFVIFSI